VEGRGRRSSEGCRRPRTLPSYRTLPRAQPESAQVKLPARKALWPETWVAPVPWTQVEEQPAWTEPVFVGALELVEAGTLLAQAERRFPAAEALLRRAAFPAGREMVWPFARAVPVRCHHPQGRSHNRQALPGFRLDLVPTQARYCRRVPERETPG
jgi:hypothetical protein